MQVAAMESRVLREHCGLVTIKTVPFYKEKMQPNSRLPKLEPLPSALLNKQTGAGGGGALVWVL